MKPSVIKYWKNGKWITSRKIFYDNNEITEWYKNMRSRIDGLSIVVTLEEANDKSRWSE